MSRLDKGKLRTVFITIQWLEEDTEVADNKLINVRVPAATSESQHKKRLAQGDYNNGTLDKKTEPRKRLLPSDRIVLQALRARLLYGGHVTAPVRAREIMDSCEISRRQVQICLRRLAEKGYIKRLIHKSDLGSNAGHQYRLTRQALLAQS